MPVNVKRNPLKICFFGKKFPDAHKHGFLAAIWVFYAHYLDFREDFDVLTKRARIAYRILAKHATQYAIKDSTQAIWTKKSRVKDTTARIKIFTLGC